MPAPTCRSECAQVWNNSAQWKGWLLAAEQAGPPAYPALLSLPPSVLAKALTAMRQGAALRPKVVCGGCLALGCAVFRCLASVYALRSPEPAMRVPRDLARKESARLHVQAHVHCTYVCTIDGNIRCSAHAHATP